MDYKREIKNILRSARDSFCLAGMVFYDTWRFLFYSGIWFNGNKLKRDYKAVKIYHGVEKSLSFKKRNPVSGWNAVYNFLHLIEKFDSVKTFHEKIGIKVVDDFLKESSVENENYSFVKKILDKYIVLSGNYGGAKKIAANDLYMGCLHDPETFFNSRYSVRDFKDKYVEKEKIYRALTLAAKAPSVCNRQAWFVYHIDNKKIIEKALKWQNGHKGFGDKIPCLLVVAADLSAFDAALERFQYWIDGGIFSMSLVMALHSIGIASCCLNWDQGPINDFRLRSVIPIKRHHVVIMMIAAGYPEDELKVCCSARKPLSDYYQYLEKVI